MAKILHVMVSKGKGGIQQAALNYAAVLDKTAHKLQHVFHQDSGGAYAPFSSYDPVALFQFIKIIKNFRPDLIISHGKRAGTLMHLARRFSGSTAQHIHVLHRYRFKGLSRFNGLWCVTDDLTHHVERLRLQASTMPLWLETLPQPVNRVPSHVIGFMGRFVPEKGADILISAINTLAKDMNDVSCILAGEGVEKEKINHAINSFNLQEKCHFIGWAQDKAKFFEQIDVLCVPSRGESFGLVILEAWAHGVPVVALPAAGPSYLIQHGINGIISSEADLSHEVQRVLLSPDLRQQLRLNGLKSVQHYTAATALPKLEQAIEAALQVNP